MRLWMRRDDFIKIFVIVFFLPLISGCGRGFHFSRQDILGVAPGQPETVMPARHDLRLGEKLTYEIKWMGIPVGIASFNVKEISQINGRDCYHIMVSVRSNSFLSKIYRVDDEFHTYMDKEKLHSLRFMKRQSEGRYRSHEVVDYDQEAHTGVYRSLINNSTQNLVITDNAQDNLSAIYYFRMQDLEPARPVLINVNADEKNWILNIKVLQAGSMSLYRIGKLKAIEVEPKAQTTEGKPLQKGRVWIWFSADENRIPLVAKARAAIVGTVTAVLTDIE